MKILKRRYTPAERENIEIATRGQYLNDNWHNMREGLITASKVKSVCSSRNYMQTASTLVNGQSLDENHLQQSILYGRKYEKPALDSFSKSHKFHHRKSTCAETGIYIHPDIPFLAASPDGMLHCKDCPKSVIEIKCLWKYKNFHPGPALLNAGICKKDDNEELYMVKSHSYYYQIQTQMATTGCSTCYFVAYTHKGIKHILIPFDPEFWKTCENILAHFYQHFYVPALKRRYMTMD